WMTDGYAVLSGCKGGKEWDGAVKEWMELERAYGFESSSKALPTAGRPAAIHAWTKGGRRPNKPPPLAVESFEKDWWAWWSGMAPAWRMKNAEGRPLQGGTGEWGSLKHPGANGLLMVMLGLAWWREKEEEVASTSWMAAVTDVAWVLRGLKREAEYVFLTDWASHAQLMP
ncbi:hypothetical protein B0H11DRAFT_1722909, partial [Mycena galericulata]